VAVSSALSIFWSPGSLYANLILLFLLYMSYPAISLGLSSSSGFGGVYDPSMK
jgi:hypothetical protein